MTDEEIKLLAEIGNLIRQTVKEFDMHPYDINDGMCFEFVDELMVQAEQNGFDLERQNSDDTGFPCHGWVYCPTLYLHFDAEAVVGVIDWKDLPIFIRYRVLTPP